MQRKNTPGREIVPKVGSILGEKALYSVEGEAVVGEAKREKKRRRAKREFEKTPAGKKISKSNSPTRSQLNQKRQLKKNDKQPKRYKTVQKKNGPQRSITKKTRGQGGRKGEGNDTGKRGGGQKAVAQGGGPSPERVGTTGTQKRERHFTVRVSNSSIKEKE